jgi:hypothetical protein
MQCESQVDCVGPLAELAARFYRQITFGRIPLEVQFHLCLFGSNSHKRWSESINLTFVCNY